jgi:hypothetical protein
MTSIAPSSRDVAPRPPAVAASGTTSARALVEQARLARAQEGYVSSLLRTKARRRRRAASAR